MIDEAASNQQRLVIKLEENAMDSLVHGIEHHLYGRRNTDWKYVILHIFHAVELFLKARLAKHDESLIYRKDGKTVGSDEAIDLLVKEANLSLFQYSEQQESGKYKGKYKLAGALSALREARNSIEHEEAVLNSDEVEAFLGTAFIFLDEFVTKELDLSLKTELDKLDEARKEEILEDGLEVDDLEDQNTCRTLSMAYFFYVQHMKAEGIPVSDPREKWIDHRYFVCEECECEEESIAVPDPTTESPGIAHCFNCLAEYIVHYCPRCDEPYVSFLQEWKKEMDVTSHPTWESFNEVDQPCESCSDWVDGQ